MRPRPRIDTPAPSAGCPHLTLTIYLAVQGGLRAAAPGGGGGRAASAPALPGVGADAEALTAERWQPSAAPHPEQRAAQQEQQHSSSSPSQPTTWREFAEQLHCEQRERERQQQALKRPPGSSLQPCAGQCKRQRQQRGMPVAAQPAPPTLQRLSWLEPRPPPLSPPQPPAAGLATDLDGPAATAALVAAAAQAIPATYALLTALLSRHVGSPMAVAPPAAQQARCACPHGHVPALHALAALEQLLALAQAAKRPGPAWAQPPENGAEPLVPPPTSCQVPAAVALLPLPGQ